MDLTGDFSWWRVSDGCLVSVTVKPLRGFKMTPARNALESKGVVVNARSRTLSHLDLSSSIAWILSDGVGDTLK